MVSGLTRNQVPGNRLRVRIPCPPLSRNCREHAVFWSFVSCSEGLDFNLDESRIRGFSFHSWYVNLVDGADRVGGPWRGRIIAIWGKTRIRLPQIAGCVPCSVRRICFGHQLS
jgi:hypothetical protein